jgi:hypothetical protein
MKPFSFPFSRSFNSNFETSGSFDFRLRLSITDSLPLSFYSGLAAASGETAGGSADTLLYAGTFFLTAALLIFKYINYN